MMMTFNEKTKIMANMLDIIRRPKVCKHMMLGETPSHCVIKCCGVDSGLCLHPKLPCDGYDNDDEEVYRQWKQMITSGGGSD